MSFVELAAAWSLQILLIGVAAEACAPLLRGAHPRLRARFWFTTLVLSLASPWLLKRMPITTLSAPDGALVGTSAAVDRALSSFTPSWQAALGLLWGLVTLVQLVRLGRGLVRLSSITREARPIDIADSNDFQVRESSSIRSPAASFLGPAILVPAGFTTLPDTWRRAALAHETIHLNRGHGLLLVVEELVLALFWFHPVVFRLVRRVRDSREEMVDAVTVEATGSSDHYRDMLIGLAAQTQIPAPAVSGTTALGARLESLIALEENPMPVTSKPRLLIASLALLGTAALAGAAAPIGATPDGPVQSEKKETGKPPRQIVSRVSVVYPASLKEQKVGGLVQLALVIDASGAVTSATARPEDHPDLAKAAIDAVRQWKFEPGEGSVQATHVVEFRVTQVDKK